MLKRQYNALINCRSDRESLIELINQKEVVGDLFNQLRLALQRRSKDRPAQVSFGPIILLYICYLLFIMCLSFGPIITLTPIVRFSMYLKTLAATNMDDEDLTESMQKLLIVMQRLDEKIAPMLEADGELFNSR